VARNLDPEKQILLGGDSGLRGYPLRYQDGDARLLFTVEQRFFTDYYPFRLLHVGGAVFFDAGRTWGGGASQLGLLRDVGLGLRLSSSRSGLGNVIHIDLAFPLDGDPSIKSAQWLVTTKASF
jgi:hemolysin activation/secretion protein